MHGETAPAPTVVSPLGAGASTRLAVVVGVLLVLWAAIGTVLGWWG